MRSKVLLLAVYAVILCEYKCFESFHDRGVYVFMNSCTVIDV